MALRWSPIALVFACSKREQAPPPPPPPAIDAVVIDAPVAIDAPPVAIDAIDPELAQVMASPPCCCALASTEPAYETQPRLSCEQDLHGRCVAPASCPKPGSVEAQLATWWREVADGKPQAHAGDVFVVEAFVPAEVFAGQTCGTPYVVDEPRANDECLRLVVVNSRPPRWRAGWGCKGFSGTDLAKSIRRDREATKDRLRCGNRSNAGVFVAVDATGKVSALLVNKLDSP